MAGEQQTGTAGCLQVNLPASQQHALGLDHVEAVVGGLFGGAHVTIAEGDDPRSQGEGVGAVGPLLPLLRHRVVTAAGEREAPARGRGGPGQAALAPGEELYGHLVGALREAHRHHLG